MYLLNKATFNNGAFWTNTANNGGALFTPSSNAKNITIKSKIFTFSGNIARNGYKIENTEEEIATTKKNITTANFSSYEVNGEVIPFASPFNNYDIGTVSEPTPPVDVTTPPVDVTTPPVDVTTPPVDVTTPPGEVTTPPVDVTTPPGEVTTPPVDVTTPPGEVTTPPGEVTTPPGEVTTPPGEVTTPPGEVTTPPGEVTTPPGEVTTPPGEVTTPPGEVTTPPGEVTTPPGEVTTPSGEVTTPPGEVTTPPGEVTTPPIGEIEPPMGGEVEESNNNDNVEDTNNDEDNNDNEDSSQVENLMANLAPKVEVEQQGVKYSLAQNLDQPDEYVVFDELGVPLGSIVVPDDVLLEEMDIVEDVVPLGGAQAKELEPSPLPTVKANPKTGDNGAALPLARMFVALLLCVIVYRGKKKLPKYNYTA